MSRSMLTRISRLEVARACAVKGRYVGIGLNSRTEAEAEEEFAEKCLEYGVTEDDHVYVVRLAFDGDPPLELGFLGHHPKILLQF
jgi:hypothetical protein